jgi:hypothetical protein
LVLKFAVAKNFGMVNFPTKQLICFISVDFI